ncbi:MAG: putative ABC exporter domain-containing protein [Planctomycetota bacterium]
MTHPLVYLYVTTAANGVRRFVARLRQPRRLLTLLATLGFVAFVAVNATKATHRYADTSLDPSAVLRAYFGLTFVLAPLSGFAERGLTFSLAEVDFLFPGPFRARALVLYHLARGLPMLLLGAVFPLVLLGFRVPRPAVVWLGAALASVVAQHLRVTASLLALHVGEPLYRRLRGPVRTLSIVGTLALIAVLASLAADRGGLRGAIAGFASSPAARVVLWPAAAVGDLAAPSPPSGVLVPLLGLGVAVLVSLVPPLLLQIGFLEASISTSAKAAEVRQRLRRGRGLSATVVGDRKVRAARAPTSRWWRGAGAIAWKNALVARRSARTILVSAAMMLIFFVPAIVAPDPSPVFPLVMGAVFPLFLSGSLAFDFRAETGHLAALKALPLPRSSIAAAEVAVPTAVVLGFQAAYGLALAVAGRVPVAWVVAGWFAVIPLTASLVAATNVAALAGSKGLGVTLLHLLFYAADGVVLALAGGAVAALGGGVPAVILALVVAQTGVLVGMIALLGRVFGSVDVAEDAPP